MRRDALVAGATCMLRGDIGITASTSNFLYATY